jgi:type IV pilus assembly protein PilV
MQEFGSLDLKERMREMRSVKRKMKEEKGFTLVEILFAITILSIGILAVASLQATAINGNWKAIQLTQATTWGQNYLEYLMRIPYDHDDLKDLNGDGDTGLGAVGTGADHGEDRVSDNTAYSINWNVSEETPYPNTKTIRLIVRWTERGVQKQVVFDYIKAQLV